MKTLIIGATENPERYAWLAIQRLIQYGHEVELIGSKPGEISGRKIETGFPPFKNIHTVSLYINPRRQQAYVPYIISLKPKRIIFNPGTENEELMVSAQKAGIQTVNGCTLVMLSTGQYEK